MDCGGGTSIFSSKKMSNGAANLDRPSSGWTHNTIFAIGEFLLIDTKFIQTPLYYISRTLADAETRYSMFEKLVLALDYTSRHIRIYFQGHPINALTWYKLKIVLSKIAFSGWLAKWAIELGEHIIKYKPRPAIKGKIPADFVNKEKECHEEQQPIVPPEQGQIWSYILTTHQTGKG